MLRRKFVKNISGVLAASTLSSAILKNNVNNMISKAIDKELKLSLAQWSLHRSYQSGELDPVDFANISKKAFEIDAIEYVNQFYVEFGSDEKFWQSMKRSADDNGVKSLLIMVDDEGDLGVKRKKARKRAVENHYKWVNAAKLLDCHSIRVNAFGSKKENVFKASIVDSMGKLSEYASKEGINVIIENHGNFSSNAQLITSIVKEVNMPNFGTFPDFGNWCTSAKWGSTMGACDTVYEPKKGVSEFLPFAKAVSAKSYDFDSNGGKQLIDYPALLKVVKESDYQGYIGIEYEGNNLNEHDGIIATKVLIEKIWTSI